MAMTAMFRRPLSVLMFDLDHFKSINDKYGHLAGDAVLAALGARMHSVLRGSDLKCRYGGEEFLVVLPDTPVEGAGRVAETVRHELAESTTRWNGEALKVTASFGVAGAHTGEVDVHSLMTRVDQALYRPDVRRRRVRRAHCRCTCRRELRESRMRRRAVAREQLPPISADGAVEERNC